MNKFININQQVLSHAELFEKSQQCFGWQKDAYSFAAWLTDDNDTNYEFYTSGTTGPPKILEFSRAQVLQSAQRSIRYFRLKPTDHFLLCIPAKFVGGSMMIARAWALGAPITFAEPALDMSENCSETNANIISFSPAQISKLLNQKNGYKILSQFSIILIGGGVLNQEDKKKLKLFSSQIFLTYGMTETLSHMAVQRIAPTYDDSFRSISKHIVFSTTATQCLKIMMHDKIIITKDLVKIQDPYSFQWLGREDDVINSGGVKLYPENIEKKIINAGLMKEGEFYITSFKDELFQQAPGLLSITPISENLKVSVNQLLDKHEKIKYWILKNQFEYTDTGKLRREKNIIPE